MFAKCFGEVDLFQETFQHAEVSSKDHCFWIWNFFWWNLHDKRNL